MFKNIKKHALNFKILRFFLIPTILVSTSLLNYNNNAKAGLEFQKMRERIMRHLNQRSEMLSGISHDLRTPLTRIKLQLAMIKDKRFIFSSGHRIE